MFIFWGNFYSYVFFFISLLFKIFIYLLKSLLPSTIIGGGSFAFFVLTSYYFLISLRFCMYPLRFLCQLFLIMKVFNYQITAEQKARRWCHYFKSFAATKYRPYGSSTWEFPVKIRLLTYLVDLSPGMVAWWLKDLMRW